MEWTGLNELREKYLSFFESKGHLRLPSFPLIPQNDNSLLLINSGMAPMKKYFTGEITPPRKRVTTCQKCIRTPDIERVGKTARHGTYFEMLGNFSFGDYFKHEATKWAWEFCTEVLEMPVDKLWVTIYLDDDEAFDIWTKEVGVAPERIVRMGKEDNFWEHGSGPCGPCSEIYFDRGEEAGCGSPDCKVGCECDRYVEFWNLVFTQFSSDGHDNYTPLDHPNIDTGMGLERLACISQGVNNLFEVDTVQNIMQHICKIANVKYHDNEKNDVSLRVITDHIRSTTFMIADGVMPSNEGRGYVLRRLLRRAARHGRLLGIKKPFLFEVCDTVIKENESAYPVLAEKRDFITHLISKEEESFERTIDAGLSVLEDMLKTNEKTLSGDDAFKLYDTFGFPIDLTKEILEEKGMSVDEDKFNTLMKEQRDRARNARKNAGADAWEGKENPVADLAETDFVGYTENSCDAKILAIVNGDETVTDAFEGDDVIVVLDKTPFYAESGGQVGDIGSIYTDAGKIIVENTTKTHTGVFLHFGKMVAGKLTAGDTVKAEICVETRNAARRNHTSAHLLQAALKQVLGNHIEQAGQLVNADAMRFDFTHFSALTKEELSEVESIVNKKILEAITVDTREMPIAEAKALGAMALFGEKYGDVVRVVSAEDFSVELCGGTHVDNTAKIGLFKIVSESSVAAGVRRIEAVTGKGVLDLINSDKALMEKTAIALKVNDVKEMPQRAENLVVELKSKEKELDKLNQKLASGKTDDLLSSAKAVGNFKLITATLENQTPDNARKMGDVLKDKDADIVAVMALVNGDKLTFFACCGKDAVANGANAGNIVREVAKICGGNGGGRPDSAMAGAKDKSKIADALAEVENLLSK